MTHLPDPAPEPPPSRDRLSAFLKAYDLAVTVVDPADGGQLFVTASSDGSGRILFRPRGGAVPDGPAMVAARVDFGGAANPLLAALPDHVAVDLASDPALAGTAQLFVAEARVRRCGGGLALDRLGAVLVVAALRRAIAEGAAIGPGLLAGLGHPRLHHALVAMHDAPARPWTMDDLAALAGLSRSAFMDAFRRVVGRTPGAYLAAWRLAVGRRALRRGDSVKAAARTAGFGSAAAFSRAFSRAYGEPLAAVRPVAATGD